MAIGDLFRLARAAFVLAREGVATSLPLPEASIPLPVRLALGLARLIQRKDSAHAGGAASLTRAVNRLGPSYIKLGQFLATRPDVVGARMARELSALQDNVPAFDEKRARQAVEAAFGLPAEQIFADFGPPIAAASIAQVHKANVLDAETGARRLVAVKILRPGVARRFERDLTSFYMVARLIERFYRPARRLRPVAVVDTLARSVVLEMDFRMEASALSEMAENTRADDGFRVPVVDWKRSSKTVLTMEWVEGRKLSDLAGLRADGHDLPLLARALVQSFLRHAMRDGFFHADMHQGNLFVDRGGWIVAVDFGIMGRLGAKERRFLAEILYGFITRNYRRVAEVHFEAGYVPLHHDIDSFAQALRAIGEPLQGHTAAEISMARLLTQLFEVTEIFEMETRPELIMLQKTMVVVEGVARILDPKLDIWKTAEPVVSEWVARHLGPVGKLENAGRDLGQILGLVQALPILASEFRLSAAHSRERAAIEERRLRATERLVLPLWIAALTLTALTLWSFFSA